jgi:truncated hemoglobin YjbI
VTEYKSPTWDPQYANSAWVRIGPANVDKAGEFIYGRIRMDRELWPYFDRYDVARIRRHVVLLLSQLLGGPKAYDTSQLAQRIKAAHEPIRHSVNNEPITLRAFWLTSRIFHAAFLLLPEATENDIDTVMAAFWSLAPVIVQEKTSDGTWVYYTVPDATPAQA